LPCLVAYGVRRDALASYGRTSEPGMPQY